VTGGVAVFSDIAAPSGAAPPPRPSPTRGEGELPPCQLAPELLSSRRRIKCATCRTAIVFRRPALGLARSALETRCVSSACADRASPSPLVGEGRGGGASRRRAFCRLNMRGRGDPSRAVAVIPAGARAPRSRLSGGVYPRAGLRADPWACGRDDDREGAIQANLSLVIPDGRKAEPGSGSPGANQLTHQEGTGPGPIGRNDP